MEITVAGKKKQFDEGLTVTELIRLENVESPEYVTVTLNDEFLERSQFDTTVLKGGEEVEFLYFMGGGAC